MPFFPPLKWGRDGAEIKNTRKNVQTFVKALQMPDILLLVSAVLQIHAEQKLIIYILLSGVRHSSNPR